MKGQDAYIDFYQQGSVNNDENETLMRKSKKCKCCCNRAEVIQIIIVSVMASICIAFLVGLYVGIKKVNDDLVSIGDKLIDHGMEKLEPLAMRLIQTSLNQLEPMGQRLIDYGTNKLTPLGQQLIDYGMSQLKPFANDLVSKVITNSDQQVDKIMSNFDDQVTNLINYWQNQFNQIEQSIEEWVPKQVFNVHVTN